MDAGERLRSKHLYKLELYLLKMIPVLISVLFLINTILFYFDIHLEIISYISGVSLIPWLFLYISSFVFKFCLYHRMFLYYIGVSECICYYDYEVGIPVTDRLYMYIHTTLFIITLLLSVYFKFKHEKCKKATYQVVAGNRRQDRARNL